MWTLSKFMLKRDRFQLLGWLVGLILLTVVVAASFNDIFATPEELMGMIMAFDNPALIAMVGPLYAETIAAVYVQNMLVFTAVIIAMMNIFMVTRHTRADEEEGRLEVLRSLPIGRTTTLQAVTLNVVLINVILAVIIGVGLGLVGLEAGAMGSGTSDFMGSMLFGVTIGATGLVFAAFTAFFVQLSANNRTVLSYSFAFLGALYLLRAVGDINLEILSIISPLGIGLRTETFVNNYWWPIFVLLGTAIIFGCLALYLNNIRDLGAGFIAEKPGRAHANRLLDTHLGLAWKLTKGQLIGWAITAFILGASYGSVFADIETFVSGNELFEQIFAGVDGADITMGFMSFVIVMMAVIVAIPVIITALKVKSEEKKNRLEHVLARSVSRPYILLSYTAIAFLAAPVMLFLTTLGLYAASSAVMDDPIPLMSMLKAVMVYLPALWVLIGIAVLAVGVFPKFTGLAWAYLGYSFVAIYLGQILNLPDWMASVTPFDYIPQYPMEEIRVLSLAGLTVVSLVLVMIGIVGYRKRDILG